MEERLLAWLRAQLGPSIDAADMAARYARLGTVRAVAVEVLRERRAALLADPLRFTLSGVVTIDLGENVRAIDRQIAEIEAGPSPDDPPADEGTNTLGLVPMVRVRRFR